MEKENAEERKLKVGAQERRKKKMDMMSSMKADLGDDEEFRRLADHCKRWGSQRRAGGRDSAEKVVTKDVLPNAAGGNQKDQG